jgi:hypothetical protein
MVNRQEDIRHKMSDSTRLRLIDRLLNALELDDINQIEAAERLLQLKCFEARIRPVHFLLYEVVPVITAPPQPSRSVEPPMGRGYLPDLDAENLSYVAASHCPFCGKVVNGSVGLKAHFGRKHKDRQSEWSGKY